MRLKPSLLDWLVMLMIVLFIAHHNVVPVPKVTVEDLKYQLFSGYYDGEYV